jgi:hypothetical protein
MARHWLLQKEITWFYSADRKRRKEECDQEWARFPDLPGEHLRWRETARGASEITAGDGRVLAIVEGVRLFPGPLMPRPPLRVTIEQQSYDVKGRVMNARVTTSGGLTVLSYTGTKNFNRQARAVAKMSDGQTLRFPVSGTSNLNAVMSAIDEAGVPVFRLRQLRSRDSQPKTVEVVVEPGRLPTPELLLAAATGYHNLENFFDRPRGGG